MSFPSDPWLPYPSSTIDPFEAFGDLKALEKNLAQRARQLLSHGSNVEMSAFFERQASAGYGATALQNLERLKKGQAVAVITGQQPCLFGGPSLVLHKTLSAISICQWLESKNISAVPVFWNASEDHDLHEMLQGTSCDHELKLHVHKKAFTELHSAESLEPLSPNEARDIPSLFARSLFSHSQKDWGSQFSQVMRELFQDQGLLVVEPRELRSHSQNFWELVETQQSELIQAYDREESSLLQRGITLQAPRRNPLPIFKLDPSTGQRLAWGHEPFKCSSSEHQTLSPGALLRPIFAQTHLPILVSVLGPSEYLYHQQCLGAFGALKQPMPFLWPRLGGTWLPEAVSTQLQQHQISVEEALASKLSLQQLLHQRYDKMDVQAFQQHFSNLLQEAHRQHPQELGALQKLESDLFKSLNRFDRRLQRLQWRQKGLSPQHVHQLQEFLQPKGGKQERSLCWSSFLQDRDHLNRIARHFQDPTDFSHRIYD